MFELGSPMRDIPLIEEDSDDDYPLNDTRDAAWEIKAINDIARTFEPLTRN